MCSHFKVLHSRYMNICLTIDVYVYYSDLQKVIRLSRSPPPLASVVNYVYDISTWLKPHIPDLHDHLKAHIFKLNKNDKGKVCMWYKEWSDDDLWLPDGGLPLLVVANGYPVM